MNHNSNEVKQLLARVCSWLAKSVPPQQMAPELLRLLIPMLVNGTKEKNSYVKANSEFALVSVLRLRQGDDTQQVTTVYCFNVYYELIYLYKYKFTEYFKSKFFTWTETQIYCLPCKYNYYYQTNSQFFSCFVWITFYCSCDSSHCHLSMQAN